MRARLAGISFAFLALLPGGEPFAASIALVTADGRAPDAEGLRVVAEALGLPRGEVVPLVAPSGAQAVGAEVVPCTAKLPVREWWQDARRVAENLDGLGVVRRLEPALDVLPCGDPALDPQAHQGLLELLAQSAQEVGRPKLAEEAYVQLLTLRPDYALPFAPGSGYEDPWNRAVGRVNERPSRPLEIVGDAVLVDGRAPPRVLRSGRHVLAWQDGTATRRGWLRVEPESGLVAVALRPLDAVAVESPAGRAVLFAAAIAQGAESLVILRGIDPLAGTRIDAQGVSPLEPAPLPVALRRPVRLGVGGGWSYVGGVSMAGLRGGLEGRLPGPLWVRIEGSLEIGRVDLGEDDLWTGSLTGLPGVAAGVVVRAPTRVAQPFAALTAGVWIAPAAASDELEAAARAVVGEEHLAVATADRGPIRPRVFLDGGVDVFPRGAPVGVRFAAGVGAGIGIQARATAGLVVPMGSPSAVQR